MVGMKDLQYLQDHRPSYIIRDGTAENAAPPWKHLESIQIQMQHLARERRTEVTNDAVEFRYWNLITICWFEPSAWGGKRAFKGKSI